MADDYVLVIDDDDDILTLITDALLSLGVEARCARDGHKGLDLIRQQQPTLVILDLVMPQITGWDFIKKVRSDPSMQGVPIMVLTGFSVDERLKKSLDAPDVHVLQKPDSFVELRQGIEDVIRGSKLIGG